MMRALVPGTGMGPLRSGLRTIPTAVVGSAFTKMRMKAREILSIDPSLPEIAPRGSESFQRVVGDSSAKMRMQAHESC